MIIFRQNIHTYILISDTEGERAIYFSHEHFRRSTYEIYVMKSVMYAFSFNR